MSIEPAEPPFVRVPDALAAEVEELGRRVVAEWARGCSWCVSARACRGDLYVCAFLESEAARIGSGG